jgi:protocatechuate 3,4-dioxygenase beta subunit
VLSESGVVRGDITRSFGAPTGVVDENYLRGVQESDAEGTLRFTTVFPGCYSGRWPHAHFEVYPSLAKATSAENLARVSLDSGMVFADGYSLQLAKVTGSNEEGYVARLTVPV